MVVSQDTWLGPYTILFAQSSLDVARTQNNKQTNNHTMSFDCVIQ